MKIKTNVKAGILGAFTSGIGGAVGSALDLPWYVTMRE